MNWIEIGRDKLLDATAVLNLVPQMTGIPSSDYVRVSIRPKILEMALASSVNGVAKIKLPSTDSWGQVVFFVDRKLFIPFIQVGQAWKGDFKLALTDDKLYVKQGSRKAEFQLRKDSVTGYVDWKEKDGLKEIVLSEELRQMLLASNKCATADPSVPQLHCVYIGGKVVLSTNLMSVFVGIRPKEDSLRFPFPVGIIPLLGDSLVKGVGVEGNRVILDCGCGYIEGNISAITQKDFPRKDIINKIQRARMWPLVAKFPIEKISKLLTRLVGYLTSVKREDWLVLLDIKNGVVKASVKVQQAEFSEMLDLKDTSINGIEVRWPLELAQAVVEYMAVNGESMRIRVDESKNTPYLLSGGGVEMIIARKVGK